MSGRSRPPRAFASDALAGSVARRTGEATRFRSASRPAKPAASAPLEISTLRRETFSMPDLGPPAREVPSGDMAPGDMAPGDVAAGEVAACFPRTEGLGLAS